MDSCAFCDKTSHFDWTSSNNSPLKPSRKCSPLHRSILHQLTIGISSYTSQHLHFSSLMLSSKKLMNRQEHIIYYISKQLSEPTLNYSHDEKMDLTVVHSVQKLFHYILIWKSNVVENANPMQYILGHRVINGKYAWWVIILQEYNLEFSTPKSKKALAIAKLITDLPSGTCDPPLNDQMTDKHLFHISWSDKWYRDILTYFRTQNFAPQLTRDDRRHIRYHAIHYLLIGHVLFHHGNNTLLGRCLSHEESKWFLNDSHNGAYGGHAYGMATAHKIMCAGYFWPTLFRDCITTVNHYVSHHVFS